VVEEACTHLQHRVFEELAEEVGVATGDRLAGAERLLLDAVGHLSS
jgi:hypothetical protein